ncbi:GNAT family N-acetyltransferase [Streptomyces sp. NPDC000880]
MEQWLPVGRCVPSEYGSVPSPLWPARSTCGLRCRASPPGQVNTAYGLYPAWRGQGLATRAVNLVCRYATAEGTTQAVIQVNPENPGSAAVARRSGFTYTKQLPDADGTRFDWYIRDI